MKRWMLVIGMAMGLCAGELNGPGGVGQVARADPAAGEPERGGPAPHLFFDTGVLAGSEEDLPRYQMSSVRIYTELGFGARWAARPAARPTAPSLEAAGLAFSLATGAGDARLGLGPRLAWRVRKHWSAQVSGGLLWSSQEEESGLFDQGWQLRAGAVYRGQMAATVLWQALPYEMERPRREQGTLHSIYGGVMFHGKPGTILSVGVWGTLTILALVFAATYRD